ncbi:MA3 domain-containing protein [Galdieria sulphuraria]|uniref:MA3 domain-containing protein n=1 Tax=Galdieria sulphuraria TaxID=130081 RepID=M2VVP7_GALSU|nr:MA3 domain-containing protein [Galdieria sulphuraria]XP_005703821.1 MA3 domain-containing protein [Galdieria sulphuraria]EME25819.1 MA3 domain-containing protein [Galdieria sulphuraria]EME27301.1 MA3 domain-containing protein [Galdieria sulphuraria]|eukprot:XP_005702339.1 MA3 domain-containing protein [Galdieria sulphuraria]
MQSPNGHLKIRSPKIQGRSPPSPTKRLYNRHSAVGRGLPKKGGAGGKGVWGSMWVQDGKSFLDKNDPNYDSDQDPSVLLEEIDLSYVDKELTQETFEATKDLDESEESQKNRV